MELEPGARRFHDARTQQIRKRAAARRQSNGGAARETNWLKDFQRLH
jgi:hypothetical protein